MEILDTEIEIVDEPKDPTYPFRLPEEGEVCETTGNKIITILLKVRP